MHVVGEVAAYLGEARASWQFRFVRAGADSKWRVIDKSSIAGIVEPPAGQWMLELSSADDGSRCQLKLARLCTWLGSPMASYMAIEFPNDASASALAAFGVWAVERIPFWWASIGFVFDPPSTWGFHLEDKAIWVAARRRWGVQVLDPVLLNRDALRGMPGVNWLTLIGNDFAVSKARCQRDRPSPPGRVPSPRRAWSGIGSRP
jgi:hypothetical protein